MILNEQDYIDLSNRLNEIENRVSILEEQRVAIVKRLADLTVKPDLGAALILCVLVITIGVVILGSIWLVTK